MLLPYSCLKSLLSRGVLCLGLFQSEIHWTHEPHTLPVPAMFSKEKTTDVLHFTPGGTETGSDRSSRNRVKLLLSSSTPRIIGYTNFSRIHSSHSRCKHPTCSCCGLLHSGNMASLGRYAQQLLRISPNTLNSKSRTRDPPILPQTTITGGSFGSKTLRNFDPPSCQNIQVHAQAPLSRTSRP